MPNWIKQLVPAEREEWPAVIWSFGWFFMLMCAYMILRPIRESFGAGLGSGEINKLFVAVFLVMLFAVPVFGKLVSVVNRRVLVHLVYHFFVLNIVVFGLVAQTLDIESNKWVSRIYFVWVSVFNLFVVSLFWSVLADLFSSEQAKRLFGPIASGATFGAICGSALTTWASTRVGLAMLLFAAAALLEFSLVFAGGLQRSSSLWKKSNQKLSQHRAKEQAKESGSVWTGVQMVLASPYLLMICGYLAMTSACGAAIYLQMADYVGDNIPDYAEKTRYFASINFFVQAGTLVLQLFLVGVVMRKLGVAWALIALPVIYLVCFLTLGFAQSLMVFAVVDILRRMFVYGVSVPAREVLFTVVDREAKYKSKNFIDTVVFRGSDAASSTLFVQLIKVIPVIHWLNFVVLPFTAIWIWLGWRLGIRQSKLGEKRTDSS